MNRLVPIVVLVVSPLLLGASDPLGDVGRCVRRGDQPRDTGSIDIIEATARATEGGFAVRFDIRFAGPLRVPDREGKPLRVDVLVRDPDVAAVSFAYYHDVNRIVRFDAVPEPALEILLLPERGTNTFLGATVHGDTLTMELPGRLLTRDVDLEGPPIERLTWSVIARDENACDLLGDGRPTLAVEAASQIQPPPPAEMEPADPSRRRAPWSFVVVLGALIVGSCAYAVSVLRRERRRDSRRYGSKAPLGESSVK